MDRASEIKRLMGLAGISEQLELANDLGVSETLISLCLNGKKDVSDSLWAKAEPYLLNRINEKRLELNRFELEKAGG